MAAKKADPAPAIALLKKRATKKTQAPPFAQKGAVSAAPRGAQQAGMVTA